MIDIRISGPAMIGKSVVAQVIKKALNDRGYNNVHLSENTLTPEQLEQIKGLPTHIHIETTNRRLYEK